MGPGPGVGARVAGAPAATAADRSLARGRSPGGTRVGARVGFPRIVLSLSAGGARVAGLSLVLAVPVPVPVPVPSVAGGEPVILAEPPGVEVPRPAVVGVPSPLPGPHLTRGLPVPLCILDLQRVAMDMVPVQLVQRLLRVPHVFVLHVSEPSRLLRVVVQRDVHVSDGSVLGEDGAQLLCLYAEGEVTDEQGGVGGAAVSA